MADKMVNPAKFFNASAYEITDVWSKEKKIITDKVFASALLKACDSLTFKITPVEYNE